jgi:hypothetical protein
MFGPRLKRNARCRNGKGRGSAQPATRLTRPSTFSELDRRVTPRPPPISRESPATAASSASRRLASKA